MRSLRCFFVAILLLLPVSSASAGTLYLWTSEEGDSKIATSENWENTGVLVCEDAKGYTEAVNEAYEKPGTVITVETGRRIRSPGAFSVIVETFSLLGVVYTTATNEVCTAEDAIPSLTSEKKTFLLPSVLCIVLVLITLSVFLSWRCNKYIFASRIYLVTGVALILLGIYVGDISFWGINKFLDISYFSSGAGSLLLSLISFIDVNQHGGRGTTLTQFFVGAYICFIGSMFWNIYV